MYFIYYEDLNNNNVQFDLYNITIYYIKNNSYYGIFYFIAMFYFINGWPIVSFIVYYELYTKYLQILDIQALRMESIEEPIPIPCIYQIRQFVQQFTRNEFNSLLTKIKYIVGVTVFVNFVCEYIILYLLLKGMLLILSFLLSFPLPLFILTFLYLYTSPIS